MNEFRLPYPRSKSCISNPGNVKALVTTPEWKLFSKFSMLSEEKLLNLAKEALKVKDLPGAVAELGVYKGGSILLLAYLLPDKPVHAFESFQGLTDLTDNDKVRSHPRERGHSHGDFSINRKDARRTVISRLKAAEIILHEGLFVDKCMLVSNEKFCFAHFDADTYQSTKDFLEFFYPRMVPGGRLVIDDVAWEATPGVEHALNEFMNDKPERVEMIGINQAVIVKKDIAAANDRAHLPLQDRLAQSGMVDFFFSRREYPERLDTFLSRATKSIEAVAVSFRLASEKGDLHGVLVKKLTSIPDFRIRLSLLQPACAAANLLARELAIDPSVLDKELVNALDDLDHLWQSMKPTEQARFELLVHDNLPFGSSYMLDANEHTGLIHVETKLHATAKRESFGFRVCGPSDFYTQNYLAWTAILNASRPYRAR